MDAKYLLIVKVKSGLIVRDRPAPESQGAVRMRAEPVGKALMAYIVVNIDGVDYAGLIPQNPLRQEWVRVAEADHSIEYVDVIDLLENENSQSSVIAGALNNLAGAFRYIGDAIKGLNK